MVLPTIIPYGQQALLLQLSVEGRTRQSLGTRKATFHRTQLNIYQFLLDSQQCTLYYHANTPTLLRVLDACWLKSIHLAERAVDLVLSVKLKWKSQPDA